MRDYTAHGIERKNQRGIDELDIEYTISCGKFLYRQQKLFFISPEDNMVVVTSNPSIKGEMKVITAYYRKNAMKYIKRKSKRTYKNKAA